MGVFGADLNVPFLLDPVSFKGGETSLDIHPVVNKNGISPLNLSVTKTEADFKLTVEGEYNYQNWYLLIKPSAHYEFADKLFCVKLEDSTFLKRHDDGRIDFGLNSTFTFLNDWFTVNPEFRSEDKDVILTLPYGVAYNWTAKQNISVGLNIGVNSSYGLNKNNFSLEQYFDQFLISSLRFSYNNLSLTATLRNNLKTDSGPAAVATESTLETKISLQNNTSVQTFVKKEVKVSGQKNITAGLNVSGVF